MFFSRATLLVVTLFWLMMSYLLWRSEYVGSRQVGSTVPVDLVWRKILTSPDSSSLEIRHEGKRMGFCQWVSNVGEEMNSSKMLNDDAAPEGMVSAVTNYKLSFEGNVALDASPTRLRFSSELKLTTNNVWQDFSVRLNLHPSIWEFSSHAADQTLRFMSQEGRERSERVFKFADLQNPQALLKEFDLPAPMALLGALAPGPIAGMTNSLAASFGLNWHARNDWVTIAHTQVRAYRLEAAILDRYRIFVVVSQVGEILRVELPDGWELLNEQLITL